MSTMTPIASQTLASATTVISFDNLPQGYTDLVLVTRTQSAPSASSDDIRIYVTLNGNVGGTNYSSTYMTGNGVVAASSRDSNRSQIDNAIQTNTNSANGEFAEFTYNIMNYSNTTTFKTVLQRSGNNSNATTAYRGTAAAVSTYRSTSAITSLQIVAAGGATSVGFAVGSTFDLYGIGVGSPKAIGGNIVTTDGTYWYHTFLSSGAFTPSQDLTVDYLVVAGGGGGGASPNLQEGAGGGGAGGLRCTVGATGGGGSLESVLSLTTQPYTVTIGAGGANNTSGSNSVFGSITSIGGGRGGASNTPEDGATGGSGGGAAGYGGGGTGGSGTANQGYAGGNDGSSQHGGGGGGAGAVGGNGAASNGSGAGGAGIATAISGASVSYAGGGGGGGYYNPSATTGGAGGTGGGGAGGNGGSSGNDGTAGTANRGGGGGGAAGQGTNKVGGAGGSGIVIVRYAA